MVAKGILILPSGLTFPRMYVLMHMKRSRYSLEKCFFGPKETKEFTS
jgi:hypothetical protein